MTNNLLSKEDFGDLSKFDGLSPFDCLLIVADKARKKRRSTKKKIRMVENVPRQTALTKKKRAHRRRRRPAVRVAAQPQHHHVLPERFREKIRELNGSDPEFVIQKELTKSDFSDTQHRFLMPKRKCAVNLDDVGEDSKVRMIVVLHPYEEPHERVVTFTYWDSTYVYVFKSEWFQFINQTTHLHKGDFVRVWTFRYPPGERGFALVKVQ